MLNSSEFHDFVSSRRSELAPFQQISEKLNKRPADWVSSRRSELAPFQLLADGFVCVRPKEWFQAAEAN